MAHVAGSDAGTWTVPLRVRIHVDPSVYEQWWARLIGIVGLHVIGALWHQFGLKDHLLLRMMRPER